MTREGVVCTCWKLVVGEEKSKESSNNMHRRVIIINVFQKIFFQL